MLESHVNISILLEPSTCDSPLNFTDLSEQALQTERNTIEGHMYNFKPTSKYFMIAVMGQSKYNAINMCSCVY